MGGFGCPWGWVVQHFAERRLCDARVWRTLRFPSCRSWRWRASLAKPGQIPDRTNCPRQQAQPNPSPRRNCLDASPHAPYSGLRANHGSAPTPDRRPLELCEPQGALDEGGGEGGAVDQPLTLRATAGPPASTTRRSDRRPCATRTEVGRGVWHATSSVQREVATLSRAHPWGTDRCQIGPATRPDRLELLKHLSPEWFRAGPL